MDSESARSLARRVRMAALLAASVALLMQAGCSSLPRVSLPEAAARPEQTFIVGGARALDMQAQRATLHEVAAEGRAQRLVRYVALLGALGEFTTADNDTRLLVDGPATFAAMFAELESAHSSIQMESYIFEDAALGDKIADVLKRKAAEGVRVRLIYDAVGSIGTPPEFFTAMAKAGVSVCAFNPVAASALSGALNHRDHRKILIVDDQVAITGGINISDVYSATSASLLRRHDSPAAEGAPRKGWRDTSVRIQGPAVTDFARLFAATWVGQQCGDPPMPQARQQTPLAGERLVTVIGSTPDDAEPRIYRALLTAIGSAEHSVHMTMSYFVPDPQTVEFLTAAARRGVDVQLLLQGESDSTLVLRAGQSHYAELLAAGVKIYERKDTLLHAKTAVIDGVWSTIGSSNVDWRSFLHNDEVNVIVFGAEFADEMEAMFQRDLQQAGQITPARWEQRGLPRRLMEDLGRLFEYWL